MYETSRRHDSSRSAIAAALVAGLVALAGCASAPRGKIMPPAVAESDSTKSVGSCGNGVVDPGESCENCPADCRPASCTESGDKLSFDVRLTVPFGEQPTSVTTLIAYDGTLMRFPGDGLTAETQKGIKNRPKGSSTFANAFGTAIRVVQTKNDGIPEGVYSVILDRCKDARDATAADLTCTVEGCAGKFGLIDGCSCSIVRSAGVDVSNLESRGH